MKKRLAPGVVRRFPCKLSRNDSEATDKARPSLHGANEAAIDAARSSGSARAAPTERTVPEAIAQAERQGMGGATSARTELFYKAMVVERHPPPSVLEGVSMPLEVQGHADVVVHFS
jgi:hypothetical protein